MNRLQQHAKTRMNLKNILLSKNDRLENMYSTDPLTSIKVNDMFRLQACSKTKKKNKQTRDKDKNRDSSHIKGG